MANHKSALKRARQSEIRRLRNKTIKTRVKNVVKAVRTEVLTDKEAAGVSLRLATATIDRAAKKGVLHKRTAARKVSRLTKLLNRHAS